MESSRAVRLNFDDDGRWCSIPDWANYFISLGRNLAQANVSAGILVVALALPTRAYAGAFVSLGLVIAKLASRESESETGYFEKLLALARGTPVLYRENNRRLRGILRGFERVSGKIYVKIQVQSDTAGSLTLFVPEDRAFRVQLVQEQNWKLPKRPGSGQFTKAGPFVEKLLGHANAAESCVNSNLVCVLVGRRNTLRQEICETRLAVHVNASKYREGRLNDVLRMRGFCGSEQACRSAFVTSGRKLPVGLIDKVDTGIVFDGATGFIRWGSLWHGRHQVVILDRTEPYFRDAVNAINERFAKCGSEEAAIVPEAETPAGGEILVFRDVAA